MPVSGPDVLVVGAGVSGLTTAVCLAEAGHGVEIRADRLPPDTTSAVAGALWGPHLVEAGERAIRWCRASLAAFRGLAAGPGSGGTGVRIASGAQVFRGPPAEPDWLAEPAAITPMKAGSGPDGGEELLPGSVLQPVPHDGVSGLFAKPLKDAGAAPPLKEFCFAH